MPHLPTKDSFPLPAALRGASTWERLTDREIPVIIVTPPQAETERVPILLWMHGRTAFKELDPGRYLRLLRSGVGVCAIDLPGHGERFDERLRRPDATLAVVEQMIDEIDSIVEALMGRGVFDLDRMAIGGMSAGGMAALSRLTREHPFACTAVEATTGSWAHQRHRAMFREQPDERLASLDPIRNLATWRELPVLAVHAEGDQWVDVDGQRAFIETLRGQYDDPDLIEFVTYGETGAPFEHIGFGRVSAETKERQRDFLTRWLRAG